MKNFLFLFSFLFLLCCSSYTLAQCLSTDPTVPVGIVPTQEDFPGGDPQCAGGFRINNPASEEYELDAFGNKVIITIVETDCGPVFKWEVEGGVSMNVIYVKGGTDQNIYDYTGENPRPDWDSLLHAPLNASGQYAGLSHIDFCFSYKLDISKTAVPSFKRTYEWTIDKSCDGDEELTLALGQVYNYPFSVTVDVSGYTDSDWKVEGVITINNPTPFDVTIASVSDVITGGISVDLDCGVTFPYVLLSGETLECTYEEDLPNADSRTNTVTVVVSSPANVEGGEATADIDFDGVDPELIDESIEVADDCNESTTTVDYSEAPKTIEYTCPISYEGEEFCGENTYVNTASFTTVDLELTDSDQCSVLVNINCETGCSLTPGYWKTHSSYGPAPYDDTWALLGENTAFYLSGQSYYEVLWTSPQGNSYYILAHAYIAAVLNELNGADVSAVAAAMSSADAFFSATTPAQAAALKGAAKNAIIALAQTLDDYNNGITGPGHCSDDSDVILSKNSDPENTETVETQVQVIPDAYSLHQNYPNPFNPSTTISFGIPEAAYVTLKIYDLLGNEITTIISDGLSAGVHSISFDASGIPSGVYLYKLHAGSFIQTKKMILMK
jgi:hypothetical protein